MRDPKEFISRLPAGSPPELADMITTALAISDRHAAKVSSFRNDVSLSEEGKRQALIALRNGSGFSQHMSQLKKNVKDSLEGVRLERSRLGLPPRDKTDLAGEIRHGEMRTYLRGLSAPDRMRLVQNDPEFRAAALAASPQLSDLPPEQHSAILEQEIETLHGARLSNLRRHEAAYEEAQAVIEIAAGFVTTAFGPWSSSALRRIADRRGKPRAHRPRRPVTHPHKPARPP